MRLALTGIGLAVADLDIIQLKESSLTEKAIQPQNGKADTADLNNYFPPRKLRRVDHFTRMTMLAACRALHDHAGTIQEDPKTPLPQPEEMGIILSTGYGPSETIFDFLDSIIDHGPSCASPLAFSHSVHNIPAATLSLFLSSESPYTTLCQTHAPLVSALNTAACWINEKRVEKVLLGLVDEKTPLLENNTERILNNKKTSIHIPIGEGAVFFLLSAPDQTKNAKYGTLEFKTVIPDALTKNMLPHGVFTPQRSIKKLEKHGIKPHTSINADMPTAAGIELAAAASYAEKKTQAMCIEQAGTNYGLIKVKTDQR